MPLEVQGAYRNLLDELWLRGGSLPNDERILAKICGDATRWQEVRAHVLAHFYLDAQGRWRNATHDEVQAESQKRARKQQNYRDRLKSGWAAQIAAQGNACACCRARFEEPWSRYVVRDHDHATDTNRGLVCQSCNAVIGRYEQGRPLTDEKANLARAYVAEWKERSSHVTPSPFSVLRSPSQDRQIERTTDSPASAGAPELVLVPEPDPTLRQAAKLVKRRPAGNGKPVQAALVPDVRLDDWPADWVDRLVGVWSQHGHVAHGRLGAALRPLRGGSWSFEDVLAGLGRYLAAGKAQFGPEPFAAAVGDWISGRGVVMGAGGALARQQLVAEANAASLEAVVNYGREER